MKLHQTTITRIHGFSLVETSIALGIAALATVSLLALLSGASNLSGESSDRFATARIFQLLTHETQMKSWDEISKTPLKKPSIYYYDESGERVNKGEFSANYAFRITHYDPYPWPDLQTSGDILTTPRQDHSRRVKMEVSSRAQFADPFAEPRFVRKLTILITKFDK